MAANRRVSDVPRVPDGAHESDTAGEEASGVGDDANEEEEEASAPANGRRPARLALHHARQGPGDAPVTRV